MRDIAVFQALCRRSQFFGGLLSLFLTAAAICLVQARTKPSRFQSESYT